VRYIKEGYENKKLVLKMCCNYTYFVTFHFSAQLQVILFPINPAQSHFKATDFSHALRYAAFCGLLGLPSLFCHQQPTFIQRDKDTR